MGRWGINTHPLQRRQSAPSRVQVLRNEYELQDFHMLNVILVTTRRGSSRVPQLPWPRRTSNPISQEADSRRLLRRCAVTVGDGSFSKAHSCRQLVLARWDMPSRFMLRKDGNFFDPHERPVDLSSFEIERRDVAQPRHSRGQRSNVRCSQETLVALEQVAPRASVLHLDSGSEALENLFSPSLAPVHHAAAGSAQCGTE